MAYNFNLHEEADTYSYGTYDFDSLMHYGQFAFSTNGLRTITVKSPHTNFQDKIGHTTHISDIDKATLSVLYPSGGTVFLDKGSTAGTENGSFLRPFKDFNSAAYAVPVGGVIVIQPETYGEAVGVHSKAMTLRAPLGGVTLGQ